MNKQREVIYTQRRHILEGISLKENILDIVDKVLDDLLAGYISDNLGYSEWDINGLINAIRLKFGLEPGISILEGKRKEEIKEDLYNRIVDVYEEKEKSLSQHLLRHMERMVFLQIIDSKWKDHLYTMDQLREGIGLRAYGQRDPLIEYKREAFDMFSQMISSIEEETVEALFKLQLVKPERFKGVFSSLSAQFLHPEVTKFQAPPERTLPEESPAPQISHPKVGRNEPCPCGKIDSRTGKPLKYKKCCYPKYG